MQAIGSGSIGENQGMRPQYGAGVGNRVTTGLYPIAEDGAEFMQACVQFTFWSAYPDRTLVKRRLASLVPAPRLTWGREWESPM